MILSVSFEKVKQRKNSTPKRSNQMILALLWIMSAVAVVLSVVMRFSNVNNVGSASVSYGLIVVLSVVTVIVTLCVTVAMIIAGNEAEFKKVVLISLLVVAVVITVIWLLSGGQLLALIFLITKLLGDKIN